MPISTSITARLHHVPSRSRVRLVTGLAAAAVLAGAGLSLPGPARAAASSVDDNCPTAFPQTGLKPGQTVNGLTVTSGTAPGAFTGKVLGTLKDGVAPGTDMILMELHSPEIDADGIWEGMSGSPVYDDATGDLIGAVSYSLSWGKSNIAGVTPFAAMRRYLPADTDTAAGPTDARQHVAIPSDRLAARVADAADISPAQASQGLSQLPTPLAIGGVRPARVAKAQRSGRPYLRDTLATGRIGVAKGGAAAAPAQDLVAGGNLTAAMVYGDVVEAGIGTVTAVCHGALVGFGHPMNGTGASTMTMMSADAITIQPDPLGSAFKVANIGGVAGTITQDRFAGISGPLDGGGTPATFSAVARYGSDAHAGRSYSTVPMASADASFFQLTSSSDAALQAVQAGGARLTYTVKGTDPTGRAFMITHADRYASGADISYDSAYDLGDLTFALSSIRGVHLTSVTATNWLDDNSDARQIVGLDQLRRGKWVRITDESPVFARPGRTAVMRLVLDSPGAPTTYDVVRMAVPAGFRGGRGRIIVVGGNDLYTDLSTVTTVPQVIRKVSSEVRNDAIQVNERLRRGTTHTAHTLTLSGLSQVVGGSLVVPVRVGRR